LGVVVAAAAVLAFIQKDLIADLILRGGDISLADDRARSSSQAKVALDFLAALRASDVSSMANLTTSAQAARIQQEEKQPTPAYQNMKNDMLTDLPADPTELRARIKGVQVHKNRSVVAFDTKANTWFVILEDVNGTWKVAEF
jgi:hypothetical protein